VLHAVSSGKIKIKIKILTQDQSFHTTAQLLQTAERQRLMHDAYKPMDSVSGLLLQALLRNARANSSKVGSVAELAPDVDKGIGKGAGFLNTWLETPAHQTFTQAYAEGKLMPLRDVCIPAADGCCQHAVTVYMQSQYTCSYCWIEHPITWLQPGQTL